MSRVLSIEYQYRVHYLSSIIICTHICILTSIGNLKLIYHEAISLSCRPTFKPRKTEARRTEVM